MALHRRFCLIFVAVALFAPVAKSETVIVSENGLHDTVFDSSNGPQVAGSAAAGSSR